MSTPGRDRNERGRRSYYKSDKLLEVGRYSWERACRRKKRSFAQRAAHGSAALSRSAISDRDISIKMLARRWSVEACETSIGLVARVSQIRCFSPFDFSFFRPRYPSPQHPLDDRSSRRAKSRRRTAAGWLRRFDSPIEATLSP